MKAKRARSLSLIEVVASLVLIATTITLLLTAHSRSLRQLSDVRHQETAAQLAQALIVDWKIDPPTSTMETKGPFEDQPGWRWRRATRPFAGALQSDLEEITLSIFRRDHVGSEQLAATYTWLERSNDR